MDSSGKQSVAVHDYGFEKFGAEGLLASSVGLGWSGLSAALLTHGAEWSSTKVPSPARRFASLSPRVIPLSPGQPVVS